MNHLRFAVKKTLGIVTSVKLFAISSIFLTHQRQPQITALKEVKRFWVDHVEMPKFYYAVKAGLQPGVYPTWDACKKQVDGFSGAKFKKFSTMEEANSFVIAPAVHPSRTEVSPQLEATCTCSLKRKLDLTSPPAKKSKFNDIDTFENECDWKAPAIKVPHDLTPIEVFTDGACKENGKAGAAGGIGVYWGPDHPLNVSEPLRGRPTNNRAEIMAAVKAVCQARQLGKINLTICTDSKFMINSMTMWIKKWKKNGWQTGTTGPVKNKDDFQKLDLAICGMNVTWKHVRGHRGIVGNERADRLAVAGVSSRNRF